MSRTERGLVLGLDGVDFDFLSEHRDSLETLDSLCSDGCYGRLRSTIPPVTSAAWSAAFSGMNPGQTGVTDFETGDGSESDIVDSTNVRSPRAWDIASVNDRRVGVVGVPLTFPVTSVDGLMVSGFLSPDGSNRFHPPAVKEFLPDDYEFFLKYSDFGPGEADEFLDRLYASTDAKFKFLKDVLKGQVPGSEDLNLVCFVLSETDMAQHYFRKQPTEDGYEAGEQTILEFFQHVDDCVSEVMELVDGWSVGLLSDHGFGKHATKYVHINQWLLDNGYLHLKNGTGNWLAAFVRNNVRSLLRMPGADHIKHLAPASATSRIASLESLSDSEIDWERTKARFSQVEENIGYARLNKDLVSDRDSLMDDIVNGLRELSDPETGDAVMDEIYRREDYYTGPELSQLPDIVFVYCEQYTGSERPSSRIVKEIPPAERPPPAHKMDGFYCLVGDGFESGHADAHIVDFMPTMYAALGVPLPNEIDGAVIEESLDFDPDSLPRREYPFNPHHEESTQTTDDIRDRLEELGYM